MLPSPAAPDRPGRSCRHRQAGRRLGEDCGHSTILERVFD
jgi:hypothetical protein